MEGGKYLSQWFIKWYIIRRFAISLWLYFLKVNHPNYRDVEIYSTQLTSLPENGSILNQLPHINKSESNNSAPIQHPPTINPLPTKLGSNVLNSKFNDNVLDTLVPNLVPDLNK